MQEKTSQNAIYFLIERLKTYFQIDTDTQLANKLGVKQNTITTWRKRESVDLKKIIAKCDNVNLNWLIKGEGEMLKEGGSTSNYVVSEQNAKYSTKNVSRDELINALEEAIKKLKGEV